MPAAARSRCWLFVINNYTDADVDSLMELPSKYLIIGFEIAPTTGTPHIQGYVQFHEGKTMKSVSKYLPRASLMKPDGTAQHNRAYCMKPESKEDPNDWYEFGEIGPGAGYRSDLEEIREMLLDNPVQYVADNRFSQWAQYGRSFNIYKEMHFKANPDRQVYSYTREQIRSVYLFHGQDVHRFREFEPWADYHDEGVIVFEVLPLSLPGQIFHWDMTGKFFVKGKYIKCHSMYILEDDVHKFEDYGVKIKSFDIDIHESEKKLPKTIPEEDVSEASGYESF